MRRPALIVAAALAGAAMARPMPPAPQAGRAYFAYACAESDDTVALVRFTASGPGRGALEVVKTIDVGVWPTEIEGPHGIAVHPNGQYWFTSLSHGTPNGVVEKYATGTDERVARVEVGLFPASMDISPTTGFLFVVNFNLYGRMRPSTVSVVDTDSMAEIAQTPTGVMPHGSRLGPRGAKHYSVTMMDDHLWEVDGLTMTVGRRLPLSEHAEHMRGMDMTSEAGAAMMKSRLPQMVQPTWATTPAETGKLYVAGNTSNEILEIDVERWTVARRFKTPANGPYNLDVTTDGRWVVVTYKKNAAIGFWDAVAGTEVANLTTTRPVPHGVVITPDQRYAFVTNEGVGGEPGTVEVYDLATKTRAAAVDIGKQAGGIAVWK
jgi:DNA-binding beta-propeller fold protein YncE